ncbi:MAG: hypothetical protein KA716_00525 [Gloeotrichia echinulata DEX184]|nr:hypothetical protein [Gloeotrichia echinulata DEX184]
MGTLRQAQCIAGDWGLGTLRQAQCIAGDWGLGEIFNCSSRYLPMCPLSSCLFFEQ